MGDLFGRLWSMLLRVALLVFGLAMFFGVMLFGIVVAIGLTVWALITGRRIAPINFGWRGPVDWRAGTRRGPQWPSSTDDVVDIEVREIDSPGSEPPRDKDGSRG